MNREILNGRRRYTAPLCSVTEIRSQGLVCTSQGNITTPGQVDYGDEGDAAKGRGWTSGRESSSRGLW